MLCPRSVPTARSAARSGRCVKDEKPRPGLQQARMTAPPVTHRLDVEHRARPRACGWQGREVVLLDQTPDPKRVEAAEPVPGHGLGGEDLVERWVTAAGLPAAAAGRRGPARSDRR